MIKTASAKIQAMRLGLVGILATILQCGTTANSAETGCGAFKWPMDVEPGWLAGKSIDVDSGSSLATAPAATLMLTLAEASKVKFTLPPEGKSKPGAANAAILTLGPLATSDHCQVTLSEEAWIDVIQDGHFVAPYDHSGAKECPGLRKSVRFELKPGTVIVQISAAAVDRLKLEIRPID